MYNKLTLRIFNTWAYFL